MEEKVIDLRKTVFELCSHDSEIPAILAEAGFSDILKPGMLSTAGRFMTIPKGAEMKHIDLNALKETFIGRGYTIKED